MVDGDHGRIETRTSLVSSDIEWLQEQHAWPGLMAIARSSDREIGLGPAPKPLTICSAWIVAARRRSRPRALGVDICQPW